MMFWQVTRPKPVPLPEGLVVKSGSNNRALTSSVHPGSRIRHGDHDVFAGEYAQVFVRAFFIDRDVGC